jgi:hypothetical protein
VSERQALRLHPRDDVAVALQALRAGRECSVAGAGEAQSLTVAESEPTGSGLTAAARRFGWPGGQQRSNA